METRHLDEDAYGKTARLRSPTPQWLVWLQARGVFGVINLHSWTVGKKLERRAWVFERSRLESVLLINSGGHFGGGSSSHDASWEPSVGGLPICRRPQNSLEGLHIPSDQETPCIPQEELESIAGHWEISVEESHANALRHTSCGVRKADVKLDCVSGPGAVKGFSHRSAIDSLNPAAPTSVPPAVALHQATLNPHTHTLYITKTPTTVTHVSVWRKDRASPKTLPSSLLGALFAPVSPISGLNLSFALTSKPCPQPLTLRCPPIIYLSPHVFLFSQTICYAHALPSLRSPTDRPSPCLAWRRVNSPAGIGRKWLSFSAAHGTSTALTVRAGKCSQTKPTKTHHRPATEQQEQIQRLELWASRSFPDALENAAAAAAGQHVGSESQKLGYELLQDDEGSRRRQKRR
ncbi:unnamed protein product [Pleuronectes platessa]|uniref:Uncharacterized protein n=1 Tax=Pleuronectes platessa TaxID=8262 RepID=A0A9N7UP02_PLEPL|nr:unnamed protein product [Pleuronectes platessa]